MRVLPALNLKGRNRFVILTKRYAIKIPSLRCWRDFLFGLLNNQNEAANRNEGACPVLWSIPGGWLIVMPRCDVLDEERFASFDAAEFCRRTGLDVEHKPDSFGILNGRVVAVDYGW